MRHIVSFSGGKDSTALILWAKENLESFETVYCDTKWEHPLTYAYLEHINKTLLDGKLIYLASSDYDGFEDLSIRKKRVPSAMARYCTEELKVIPMMEYLSKVRDEKIVYQGIRADESPSRSKMADEGYDETYKCIVKRPLFRLSAMDCFALMQKWGVEPNPLYKMGARRVGCMPCIMVNQKEMAQIIKRHPEVIERVRSLEQKLGRTFFAPNYIPEWAHSSRDPKTGKTICFIDDVVKYLTDKNNANQIDAFPDDNEGCMSYYALCGI